MNPARSVNCQVEPRDCQRGFSLLEIVVSLLLITIASLVLLEAVALSFEVIARCRLLRVDSVRHRNNSQRWRSEVGASTNSPPAFKITTLADPGSGAGQWEVQHGTR